ncbi:hypothetical protein OWR29_39100 [Actinoplanes sp. Pm04-4]|uniref:Transmembrane protein n=1 Tax=Paractinoplanes pyxinae TaxID=2997416 RepID=A0ABT4BBY7_9ACTN|nr:hypothetical protein [Actinoplanes pyxinae]MCY1144039.1 hypothetical protein [Actinoplanes pyxinae]
MAKRNRKGPTARRPVDPQEREAATAEYQTAIDRFQRSAFWNLRTRIANASILLGVFAVALIVWGEADGARLVPTLACAVGGVCGAGVYASRPYPQLTRWLLLSAVTLTVLGVVGLAIAAGAGK